ncbi:GAF and ANTAR domain-containing protein [Humibacillus xanthopallidus]|uniref:ANTAR domain-containing protein n=1 Tax=Humibacillus xanthopallidus TaxID=412689 RepID=A0A543HUG2_9MICO|nr:GAF and ANTAR domain-containing protein [Humibacillus xanthopallidus]TQM61975.1 ANTAR domain-containing protein [Humibacillus xanthopallidus]
MTESPSSASVPGHLRRVAEAFERLGRQLHASGSNPFDAVTELALERVPHAAAASITTVVHGRFVTASATDDIARRADAIQYDLGSGPCIDAIVDQTIYQPKDLASDLRWPDYGRRVDAELGLRSMLSYRMNLESTGVIAGLNLYAHRTAAFDEHDLAEGLLLTTHAAQAVGAAHLRDRADNLQRALDSNRDIATAVGVLMSEQKITRDQAFDLLRIASQNTNRKLREVALDVIETGALDVTPRGWS